MSSHQMSENSRERNVRGTRIIELLLVLGVSTALLALTLPYGLDFYRRTLADETLNDIVSVLRVAERYAALGKYDRMHGVKFLPGTYTLFQGDTYTTRLVAEDRIYQLPDGATILGMPDEIIFEKISGQPSATGTMTLSYYERIRHVRVLDGGIIEYGE